MTDPGDSPSLPAVISASQPWGDAGMAMQEWYNAQEPIWKTIWNAFYDIVAELDSDAPSWKHLTDLHDELRDLLDIYLGTETKPPHLDNGEGEIIDGSDPVKVQAATKREEDFENILPLFQKALDKDSRYPDRSVTVESILKMLVERYSANTWVVDENAVARNHVASLDKEIRTLRANIKDSETRALNHRLDLFWHVETIKGYRKDIPSHEQYIARNRSTVNWIKREERQEAERRNAKVGSVPRREPNGQLAEIWYSPTAKRKIDSVSEEENLRSEHKNRPRGKRIQIVSAAGQDVDRTALPVDKQIFEPKFSGGKMKVRDANRKMNIETETSSKDKFQADRSAEYRSMSKSVQQLGSEIAMLEKWRTQYASNLRTEHGLYHPNKIVRFSNDRTQQLASGTCTSRGESKLVNESPKSPSSADRRPQPLSLVIEQDTGLAHPFRKAYLSPELKAISSSNDAQQAVRPVKQEKTDPATKALLIKSGFWDTNLKRVIFSSDKQRQSSTHVSLEQEQEKVTPSAFSSVVGPNVPNFNDAILPSKPATKPSSPIRAHEEKVTVRKPTSIQTKTTSLPNLPQVTPSPEAPTASKIDWDIPKPQLSPFLSVVNEKGEFDTSSYKHRPIPTHTVQFSEVPAFNAANSNNMFLPKPKLSPPASSNYEKTRAKQALQQNSASASASAPASFNTGKTSFPHSPPKAPRAMRDILKTTNPSSSSTSVMARAGCFRTPTFPPRTFLPRGSQRVASELDENLEVEGHVEDVEDVEDVVDWGTELDEGENVLHEGEMELEGWKMKEAGKNKGEGEGRGRDEKWAKSFAWR
ncbi:MAG: hypothetical protein MMC33_009762 [Icmadophila ericetorum]|nr:hypothetical protein [Icmadophila ericetorum]